MGGIRNYGLSGSANQSALNFGQANTDSGPRAGVHAPVYLAQFEYRTTLACGDQSSPDRNLDPTDCGIALTFCVSPPDSPRVYYYTWWRPVPTATSPNPSWRYDSAYCGAPGVSVDGMPAPPAVPSMAQIRQAFADLPFGRPTVAIQPVGGVTLVNLPTFYEVQWDQTGLQPGQISQPVQLLSWSVEFEVGLSSYDINFGDGTTSGPTKDPGGPYPHGSIRHAYTQPLDAAEITASTELVGRFRVNGGAWQDLPGVANLPDLPVSTLRVAEARSQLVNR